jgi:hypothetical protein
MLTQVVARVRKYTPPKKDEVIVVVDCPDQCGRYHHPVVDLSDADAPTVRQLLGNCACGAMLDTPTMLRDVIGTARNFLETVHLLGRGSLS